MCTVDLHCPGCGTQVEGIDHRCSELSAGARSTLHVRYYCAQCSAEFTVEMTRLVAV